MTLAVQPTLSDLLPENFENLGRQMREQLGKDKPGIGWSFVEKQCAQDLRGAFKKVDLCEQLAQAWVTLATLKRFRDQPPGETAVIQIPKHGLSFTASPTLKVKIGDIEAPDLKFTYAVKADLDHATLSICGGALMAIEPGDCAISAVLSCGKVPLHTFKLAALKLPSEIRCAPPWKIPLV